MRAAPATGAELTTLVDALLASPQPDVPDDSGLDDDTAAAIERAWRGGSTPALADAARRELAMQLDGTHAREAQAAQDQIFQQVLDEQGVSDEPSDNAADTADNVPAVR